MVMMPSTVLMKQMPRQPARGETGQSKPAGEERLVGPAPPAAADSVPKSETRQPDRRSGRLGWH